MEVEILSTEIIKRSSSSQTSEDEIKIFKLSVLDQLSPLTYTSLIFFYTLNQINDQYNNPSHLSTRLKNSLSENLAKFHLLSGRIKDNQVIICNGDDDDEGALFSNTRVNSVMSEFLKQPRFELLSQLVPCSSICTESSESSSYRPQVSVQLNVFSCGGVALGTCFLHKIIDGITLSNFIKSWASLNRELPLPLLFDEKEKEAFSCCEDYRVFSSLFPHREGLLNNNSDNSQLFNNLEYSPFICRGKKKSCTRRFVFEEGAIADLKDKAKSKEVPNPTTVEVVTGFIWKYAIEAARQRSGSKNPSVLTHAVNLRPRMDPPLSGNTVGNIFWSALAYYDSSSNEEDQIEMVELVKLLRQSFEEINSNYINKMTREEGFESMSNSLMHIQDLYSKRPDSYGFTSWLNMGLNEVDFGWGKPSWVSFGGLANSILKNVVILKEAISGYGVEAWVILDEDQMNLLQNNQQFLAFSSLNPNVNVCNSP